MVGADKEILLKIIFRYLTKTRFGLFHRTAKFRRFFLGKLSELLAINHSSSERWDILFLGVRVSVT